MGVQCPSPGSSSISVGCYDVSENPQISLPNMLGQSFVIDIIKDLLTQGHYSAVS